SHILGALALAFVCLPGWADVSGSLTLAVNATLDLDAGTGGSSGGDVSWNGTSLNAQSTALMTFLGFGVGSSSNYDGLDLAFLSVQQYIVTTFPIPIPSQQALFGVKTRKGNYAKLLITGGTLGGSINVKFTTFGQTGGGGPSGPSISAIVNNYGVI